ncbi:MAG: hypothetical protein WBY94_13790, partial [Polyangiaceae bacterium]
RVQRWQERLTGAGRRSMDLAQRSPRKVLKLLQGTVERAPDFVERVKLDAKLLAEARKASKARRIAVLAEESPAE